MALSLLSGFMAWVTGVTIRWSSGRGMGSRSARGSGAGRPWLQDDDGCWMGALRRQPIEVITPPGVVDELGPEPIAFFADRGASADGSRFAGKVDCRVGL